MRTASIHCPKCDATQLYFSFQFPGSAEDTCTKCGAGYRHTQHSLADKFAHVIAQWAFVIVAAIMAVDLLLKLKSIGQIFVAVFVAAICGLGAAFLGYVLGRALFSQKATQLVADARKSSRLPEVHVRIRRGPSGNHDWDDES